MAQIIKVPTFNDSRGSLSVLENTLPFRVERVFYIYNIQGQRGAHGHKVTKMALIALGGAISVEVNRPGKVEKFLLDSPEKCLLLDPEDWHTFESQAGSPTLLVLASHKYDKNDYVFEKPS